MNGLFTVASFIFALAILITFHEFGHYLVARLCNVRVLRFSLGFGKVLYSRRVGRDQTEWALAAIPLGGYVKMLDEQEGPVAPQEAARAFNRQSVGKRFAIVAAGPIANFLLAIAFYWVLFVAGIPAMKPYLAAPAEGSPAAIAGVQSGELVRKLDGVVVSSWQDLRWNLLEQAMKHGQVTLEVEDPRGHTAFKILDLSSLQTDEIEASFLDAIGLMPFRPVPKPVFGRVMEGGAAAAAGLKAGDEIVAIDSKPLANWDGLVDIVRTSPEKKLTLSVRRGENLMEIPLTPVLAAEGKKNVGKIGAAPRMDEKENARLLTTIQYPAGEAVVKAVGKTWETSIFSLKMLGKMLTGDISWKNLSGPITIADYAGQSAQLGWMSYITFLALISISLGVMNLLPVPLLDGGHLMYYTAEIIKGSPVSAHAMEIGSRIGIFLLLCLTAFAFYNDINRLLLN